MNKLPQLNFKKFNFRFKKSPSDAPLIFDAVRKKWLVLTPEEWVRQNLIRHLIEVERYPEEMFKIETGLSVNQNQRRSDILIYKDFSPHILIECKSMNISINEKVLNQALNYNLRYKAPLIILSNGFEHFSFKVLEDRLERLEDFPVYK